MAMENQRIDDIDEANRVIKVLMQDVKDQHWGKRFWMWTFIISAPFQAIFGEFLRGFWSGVFGG